MYTIFQVYIYNIFRIYLAVHIYFILIFIDELYIIDYVYIVVFSPDNQYLASGSLDQTVNLIDIQSKTLYFKFDNIHSGICLYI